LRISNLRKLEHLRRSQDLATWADAGQGGPHAVSPRLVQPPAPAYGGMRKCSGAAKIDPLMAAFNAVAVMSTNPWSARPHLRDL
jgi:hypothetical protein